MRIDAYTHFIPEKFFAKIVESHHPDIGKRVREIPCIHDLDARKKVVDTFPDYAQILSYPMPPVEILAKGEQINEYAKLINDGFADICKKDPDHFPGWVAEAPIGAPDAGARECERAIKSGALGVQIHTNIAGQPLDEPRIRAVLGHHEPARQAGVAAPGARRQFPRLSQRAKIEIRNLVDLRLVLRDRGGDGAAGVLQDHGQVPQPENHHPPFRRHRADAGRPHRAGLGPARRAHLGRGPARAAWRAEEAAARLLQAFVLRRHRGVRRRAGDAVAGLAFYDLDKIVFASDCPFDPEKGTMYTRETLRILDGIDMPKADKEKIWHGNLERITGVKLSK